MVLEMDSGILGGILVYFGGFLLKGTCVFRGILRGFLGILRDFAGNWKDGWFFLGSEA